METEKNTFVNNPFFYCTPAVLPLMNEVNTPVELKTADFNLYEEFSGNGESGFLNDLKLFWKVAKRFKWLFAFSFIAIALFTFWHQNRFASYKSTARFMVMDWSQTFQPVQNSYYNDHINQILMTLISDSVIQYVAETNHLLDEFKDPEQEKKKQNFLYGLLGNISLRQSDFNSFSLEVQTDDPDLSAKLANDIVSRASEEGKKIYIRELTSRIEVMGKLLDEGAQKGADDRAVQMKFTNLGHMLEKILHKNADESEVLQIMMTFADLKKTYDDRASQLHLNEIMLNKISQNNVATIVLIQRAVPDLSNYFFERWLFSIGIALVCCSVLPLCIYGVIKIREKEIRMT